MHFLIGQILTGSLLWLILGIAALAILIWFLSWLLFPETTIGPVPSSLMGLDGLDESMAAKLRGYGINTDRDLMRLSPRGQQELESQLGLHNGEYEGWRRQVLKEWRAAYLPRELRDCDAIFPDPELGGLYAKKPDDVDDLTRIPGIDSVAAGRMNTAGIYTFEQLKLLTPEQRANLTRRFNLSGLSFDTIPSSNISATTTAGFGKVPKGGLVADAGGDSWVTPSSDTASHDRGSSEAGTKGREIPPAKKAADSASGVTVDRSHTGTALPQGPHYATPASDTSPAATGSAQPSTGHSSKSDAVGAQIPRTKIDAELGRVYTAPPPHRDNLKSLPGIDALAESKLNAAGVYTIDQLLSLSPNQQAGFKRRFDLANVDFGSWRSRATSAVAVPPSKSVSASSSGVISPASSSSPSQSGVDLSSAVNDSKTDSPIGGGADVHGTANVGNRADETAVAADVSSVGKPNFGYVYTSPPNDADDLTQLDGISPELAKKLNLNGIYKFEQLRSMSADQRKSFLARFGLPSLSFDRWLPSIGIGAAGIAALGAVGSKAGSDSTSTSPRMESGRKPVGFAAGSGQLGGQSAVGSEHVASASLPGSKGEGQFKPHPIFERAYVTAPSEVDDFSRLGLDTSAAKKLNDAGIFKYEQLKNLNSEQQSQFRREFGLPNVDFSEWRRCIHAWSRGIETTLDEPRTYQPAAFHGVRLPEIVPGVYDGKQLVAYPEQVIFRGSNPENWGANVSADGTVALSADEIRSDINYVRVRRVDTRESVVTAVTKGQLFAPGPNEGNGWNGLCDCFFGGRHLGVFARGIPNEVETKFGIGGWGFGHRFDHNDQQEWAWAGRLLEPTVFEISVGHVGSPAGTVVFRSNDPTIWNQRVREGRGRMAMPIAGVSHPIAFLRLMRTDTGEAVIVRVDKESLLGRGQNPRLGWNGLNDHFSGGHHLGIYHREAPQDVEICFGEGGWGFGHPYGDNDRQAYGWGGHDIGETVFEISLLPMLPDYLRHELLD